MADDNFFIEKWVQGNFAIRKTNSQRASTVAPTQKKAIAKAKDINRDAAIHVERVRKTSDGSPISGGKSRSYTLLFR